MNNSLKIPASSITELLGTVGSPLIVITELIKNAIDASADNIDIIYNRNDNIITVSDDGNGFSLDDILHLSTPGQSNKKRNGNLTNDKGLFYTGSKGLGLLSVFSLCERLHIQTRGKLDGEYEINWTKTDGEYSYDKSNASKISDKGSIITLINVNTPVMNMLTSELEIKKMRQISTFLFKYNKLKWPNITLTIDNNGPISLLFKTDFLPMLYDVIFNYSSSSGKLSFQCISDNPKINNKPVELSLYDQISIDQIMTQHFGVAEFFKTRINENVDFASLEGVSGVPSFEGRLLVYERRNAGGTLKNYGAGVKFYVNEFAMYNYLSDEYDWLGLADFSLRRKVTRLKPHNVFGFINLPNFDETNEELKISNERADFIQDVVFLKLMYLIKGVIIYMIINIDIAEKNSKLNVDFNEDNNGDNNNENQTESMEQEDKFDPINIPKIADKKVLGFTNSEGIVIRGLINKDDLSNKIYQLVYELHKLNILEFPYATVYLYRSLLESVTQYACDKLSMKYNEKDLAGSIINVLNVWSRKSNTREFNSQIVSWRDLVAKRKLVQQLNLFVHYGSPVDSDLIFSSWKTMKTYIVNCIEGE